MFSCVCVCVNTNIYILNSYSGHSSLPVQGWKLALNQQLQEEWRESNSDLGVIPPCNCFTKRLVKILSSLKLCVCYSVNKHFHFTIQSVLFNGEVLKKNVSRIVKGSQWGWGGMIMSSGGIMWNSWMFIVRPTLCLGIFLVLYIYG